MTTGYRYQHANYEAKNITIVGTEGTTFSKLRLGENDYHAVMTGWTFKNIAFADGDGLLLSMCNSDVTLDNCTFTNTHVQAAAADCTSQNLTVKDCTFNGSHATSKTQLHIERSNGLTVSGCTFKNGLYNAMALSDIRGDVTVDGNIITGSADRAFRFSGVGENVEIVVKYNTITDSAREKDGKEQVICIGNNDGVPETSSITFSGNTYDGAAWADGITIANTSVETIICSDNTRIDG